MDHSLSSKVEGGSRHQTSWEYCSRGIIYISTWWMSTQHHGGQNWLWLVAIIIPPSLSSRESLKSPVIMLTKLVMLVSLLAEAYLIWSDQFQLLPLIAYDQRRFLFGLKGVWGWRKSVNLVHAGVGGGIDFLFPCHITSLIVILPNDTTLKCSACTENQTSKHPVVRRHLYRHNYKKKCDIQWKSVVKKKKKK